MKRLSGKDERGFALLLVLWGLMILSLLTATFLRETRAGTTLARNVLENAKAEALAEAAVTRAILGLLDPDPRRGWRADGRRYQFALGEGRIEIRIQDEAGKIDLNHASAATLRALLQVAGQNSEAARSMADSILDYADPDSDRRPAGAEDPDYAAAGRMDGSKDAPFENNEELLNVLGLSNDAYDAISGGVTVFSEESEADPRTAPEVVLRAMPGLSKREIDQIMAMRSIDAPSVPRTPVEVVTINAQAATQNGGRYALEAIARVDEDAAQPFEILSWRHFWLSKASGSNPAPAAEAR